MQELIEAYSLQEILLFLVTFALAIKGLVSFWDWGYGRLKQVFKKESDQEDAMESIQNQIKEHEKEYKILQENQEALQNALANLTEKIEMLIQSDKDDIKAYITKEHHFFCYQKHWIDDYSLDCIERRYKHYKEEGGNSFIHDLMEELRELPKRPPQEEE